MACEELRQEFDQADAQLRQSIDQRTQAQASYEAAQANTEAAAQALAAAQTAETEASAAVGAAQSQVQTDAETAQNAYDAWRDCVVNGPPPVEE